MTSPDLDPPSYLSNSPTTMTDPFTSPPQRKARFTSYAAKRTPAFSTTKENKYDDREFQGLDLEALPPPTSLILPPPAVTTYAYAPSASSYALHRSPLHSLQKQTKKLTEELQVLLDAQGAALMSGGTFSGARPTGGGSPYLQGTKRDGRKKTISLQEARNGVLKAMRALAEIKDVEEDVYASQAAERENFVKTVEGWGNKRQLLESEIHAIEEGEDGQRAEALREEKSGIENELHQLRLRLTTLEAKHSSISMQLSELDSTISSKKSSYQASLTSLKQKTAKFLSTHRYALPSTAVESWTLEKEALDEKKQQAQTEGDALRDGIVMWEDALSLVSSFEEKLRAQLMASAGAMGKPPGEGGVKEKILQDIEDIIDQLEQRLKLAEERGWKLLVCCVGAELQVFLEAREVMQRSLGNTPAPSILSTETTKDSGFDDGGSQHDGRESQSSKRNGSAVGSSKRSVFRGTARDPVRASRRGGPRSTSGPSRRIASPVGGNSSILDRSDDGHSEDSRDISNKGEDKDDEELLLKVDDSGDGTKDYSPLDD